MKCWFVLWMVSTACGAAVAAEPKKDAGKPAPFASIRLDLEQKPIAPLRRFVVETTRAGRPTQEDRRPEASRGVLTLRTRAASGSVRCFDAWDRPNGRLLIEQAADPAGPLLPNRLIRIDRPDHQKSTTQRFRLEAGQMVRPTGDPIAWPKNTVPFTALLRLTEHLPTDPAAAYGFKALYDPARDAAPAELGFLLRCDGPKPLNGQPHVRWHLKSLEAEPPQVEVFFWVDADKKLARVDRPGLGLRWTRIDPVAASDLKLDLKKLRHWKQKNFRFSRTFRGSDLKMTGTWEARTRVQTDRLHLHDRFTTRFGGNDTFVSWEAQFGLDHPLMPRAYNSQEGHEDHRHQVRAENRDGVIHIRSTQHNDQVSELQIKWPADGAMRIGLARLVSLLPKKIGWAVRFDRVFDDPVIDDHVVPLT
ncbi:MAG: hypothetical protein R3236_11060, partial [Phycisphaeraceae bacterium]|nr:hypothetical protein [Phycisphaeraceae bacterium]